MLTRPNGFTAPLLTDWVPRILTDPEPPWLIDEFFPRAGLTLIAGRPKRAYKSWFALLAAMALASGKSTGFYRIAQQCNVLYVDRESGQYQAALRPNMLAAGGCGIRLTDCAGLYYSHGKPFYLDEPDQQTQVLEFVHAKQIGLVIVDTFARSMLGDENRTRDLNLALLPFDGLRAAGCGLCLIHHVAKGSDGAPGQPLPTDENVRGSTVLAGAYESILNIQNAIVGGVPKQFLVRGGKYIDYAAYEVAWEFEKNARATLSWSGPGPIPLVDAQPNSRHR